jgi:pimeloyl-ACP methyl ester carboxylesterase
MNTRRITHQTIAFFLIAVIVSSFTLPTFAQDGRNPRQVLYPNGPVKERPKYCNGGWSGVVTFTKTLSESLHTDEPLPGRIDKAKNRIKHDRERSYKYIGRATVDAADPVKPVVNTRVSFTDDDKSSGQQKEYDSCHAFNDEHFFYVDGVDNSLTEATAQGPAMSFGLSLNEALGTYSFNLKFPEAKRRYTREEHVKRSGFCQPKNNEPSDRSIKRDHVEPPQGFTIENQKIDPAQPDLLAGTYSWGDDGRGAVRTFVFTVTWRFTRCPGKLLITDLKFEQPKFPDWNNWQEFDPYYDGTKDGNRVRITAKVLNMAVDTKYVNVKLSEDQERPGPGYQKPPDIPIPDGEASVRIEAGEERDVQFIWDTEGQSWNDYGQPHSSHDIKAEAFEDGKSVSSKIEMLKISPKPIVMVHGLWSSPEAFGSYQNMLTMAGNGDWRAYAVGEKPGHGRLQTGGRFMSADKTMSVFQNADEVAQYVRYAQEDSNAWHVDMVGHDLGGLTARVYIHKLMAESPDGRPVVKHLMMLGTPNNGAPCADVMALKFTVYGDRVQGLEDMLPDRVAKFNQYVSNRRGVKFSALAGNSVPVTCGGYIWNDGLVPVESAIYGIEDHAYSNDFHDKLTNDRNMGMFVFPHVITGPKGTYPRMPVRSDPNDWRRWNGKDHWVQDGDGSWWSANRPSYLAPSGSFSFGSVLMAHYRKPGPGDREASSEEGNKTFSHEVKLAAGGSVVVDVPVRSASNFGLAFLGAAAVSATLTDDRGTVRDTNLKGSPESGLLFRPLFTGRAVQDGIWKLRLENTSSQEEVVLIAAWRPVSGISLAVKAQKPNAAGVVSLNALVTNGGAALTNARVIAKISGLNDEIVFIDDGAHGDGAAGDGIFGAVTGKLEKGDYTVEARAEMSGQVAYAATSLSIGVQSNPTPAKKAPGPVRPVTRKRRGV